MLLKNTFPVLCFSWSCSTFNQRERLSIRLSLCSPFMKEKILEVKENEFLPYILVFLFTDYSDPALTQNIWDPQVYVEELYSDKIMLLNIVAGCYIPFIIKSHNLILQLSWNIFWGLVGTQSLSCAHLFILNSRLWCKSSNFQKRILATLAPLDKHIENTNWRHTPSQPVYFYFLWLKLCEQNPILRWNPVLPRFLNFKQKH